MCKTEIDKIIYELAFIFDDILKKDICHEEQLEELLKITRQNFNRLEPTAGTTEILDKWNMLSNTMPEKIQASAEMIHKESERLNTFYQAEKQRAIMDLLNINTHKHAKEIVKRLTSRPLPENPDGYYDMFGDERRMIKIVENYLSELRQKLGQNVQEGNNQTKEK